LVKTQKLKDWKINEYTIMYSQKTVPSGPPYYEYDIYKGSKYLSYAAYKMNNDSCKLLFRERNDYYILFDLCNSEKSIVTAERTKLKLSSIDSITIRPYDSVRIKSRETYIAPFYDTIITKNFDSTITKRLTDSQIKTLVKRWNSSKVNGFDRLGKGYDYLITVHKNGSVRRLRTLNFFITENGLWSYRTREDTFFDTIWLENK
jgi:hypothetical protein